MQIAACVVLLLITELVQNRKKICAAFMLPLVVCIVTMNDDIILSLQQWEFLHFCTIHFARLLFDCLLKTV